MIDKGVARKRKSVNIALDNGGEECSSRTLLTGSNKLQLPTGRIEYGWLTLMHVHIKVQWLGEAKGGAAETGGEDERWEWRVEKGDYCRCWQCHLYREEARSRSLSDTKSDRPRLDAERVALKRVAAERKSLLRCQSSCLVSIRAMQAKFEIMDDELGLYLGAWVERLPEIQGL